MRWKILTVSLCIFFSTFLFVYFSLNLSPLNFHESEINPTPAPILQHQLNNNNDRQNSITSENHQINTRQMFSLPDQLTVDSSVLLPDWEILITVLPSENNKLVLSDSGEKYYCVFQNNSTSPAKFAGTLPSSGLDTYRCVLPENLRRYRTIQSPIVTKSTTITKNSTESSPPEMIRWNLLVYESLSTEDDLILFVKGVNNRQGFNRPPSQLRCVFNNVVITTVTISSQEVFRCLHPNATEIRRLLQTNGDEKIRVTLQVQQQDEEKTRRVVVPSVAYYTPPPPRRSIAPKEEKALLCACTMVYNVAKFIKEWVAYNSKLGVEKFVLYDNGSEDELGEVLEELIEEGSYNVERIFWPWPKTQEAGFSHSAMNSRDSCTWMMYVDVDEFVYSPKWLKSSNPSQDMLRNLLPTNQIPSPSSSSSSSSKTKTGQVSINCLEYGPSNQKTHPVHGVTQGYTCRRRLEQRHKSIVLLDAVNASLLNVIHHFELKDGYKMNKLSLEEGVVNHYKYQAWSDFKVKFRRRVSTYVVDWTKKVNPTSKDRTPGLGFEAIEPKDWDKKFCEVHDNRLQVITKKWFGSGTSTEYKMVWQ